MRKLLLILLTLASFGAGAVTPWDTILDTKRATDWSAKGVSGGIPTRNTICQTLSSSATAAQINTAIANCGSGQVVKLNAGTYNLSTGITFAGRSNVTLRGAGPDQTFLTFTGVAGCQGQNALICIEGNDLDYWPGSPPTHTANWTAGFTQGTTVVTLSSTTGLSVGMFIQLDQADDTSDPGTDLFNCDTVTTCTSEGGSDYGRTNRSVRQWAQVTNISGSDVTITPALFYPDWNRSGKTPGAYWGGSTSFSHNNGIEDLSVDGTGSGVEGALITLIFTYDSWVKNVRGVYAPVPRAYVECYFCIRSTIRDSYFFGSLQESSTSTHYGVSLENAGDILVENNIFHRRSTAMIANGAPGSVFAYNFAINNKYPDANFMQLAQFTHEAGNYMILWESNDAVGIAADNIHGTGNLVTHFRQYSSGYESGLTDQTTPVAIHNYNRFYNVIGGVFGTSGYHDTYEVVTDDHNTNQKVVFSLGQESYGTSTTPFDSVVPATIMRWGNYDTVTSGTYPNGRFLSAEVPSGIAKYANSVPANNTLPSSFYLSSKPSFYGSNPWPSIGPDVNCGTNCQTGVDGHVRKIPARLCWESLGAAFGDTTPKSTFNANTCYASSPLPAPTNLRARPIWWKNTPWLRHFASNR